MTPIQSMIPKVAAKPLITYHNIDKLLSASREIDPLVQASFSVCAFNN